MLWIKAFHIIFVVTWFSGLFYLPRLYVYHAMSTDQTSIDRFILMERKLYFGITTPSALLATGLGLWLLSYNWSGFLHMQWMIAKLILVAILWLYHLYLGKLWLDFKQHRNKHGHVFYRWLNEFPVLILVGVILLAIIHPRLI